MKIGTVVLGAGILVLLGLSLFSDFALTFGLASAAVLVSAVIFAHRPRTLAWRLAGFASALWAIEEIAWAVRRSTGLNDGSLLTDVTYYGGALLWVAALLLLHGRRMTRQLWLPLLPAIAGLAWLMFYNIPLSLQLQFPFIDIALVLVAVPAIEPAMRGRASAGRLLLVLAFFLRGVSSATFSWLFSDDGLRIEVVVVWVLAYALLALAAHLELSGTPAELFVTVAVILGLQLPIAALATMIVNSGRVDTTFAVMLFLLLAYVQLVAMLLIVVNYRRRRMVAETELGAWGAALEDVVRLVNDDEDRHSSLLELLAVLRQRLPTLHGMVLHENAELRVGDQSGYEYPLVSAGAEVGRFYFDDQPENLNVLDAVSPFLAARLQQSMEQAAWVSHAITDPLTGILNRRGLDLRAAELLTRAAADKTVMSVVMIDLDRFKRVNDFYGHTVGDQTLKALAKILHGHMRADDLAVRWGGEEFVIVLYDADTNSAADVIRRIRSELRESKNPPVSWVLTVSAGIAGGSVPTSRATLDRWIEEADAALKHAKDAGRDRIEHSLSLGAAT